MNITRLNKSAGAMPLWLLAVIIAVAVYYLGDVYFGRGYIEAGDSCDYIYAAKALLSGHSDRFRPPLYPLLILVISSITDIFTSIDVIITLQWIVWIVSMYCFWLFCDMAGVNRVMAIAASLSIILIPGVVEINSTLLPESLNMSGVVFLLFICAKSCRAFKAKYIWRDRSMLGQHKG